jgi:hypothetical protein
MADFQRIFTSSEAPVLSFEVQARLGLVETPQRSVFQVLVRHFLGRFLENDVVSLGGDTLSRMVQVLCAVTVPGVVAALYLIPAYYGFPPNPLYRPYWPQVADHYFYIVYSFVLTGAVTVLEWDLVFPDLLDVLVLTPLPIAARQAFSAKLLAMAIFLGCFLVGTNVLPALLLSAVSGHPMFHHTAAHFLAVVSAGLFAALFFIALQGVILLVAGRHIFRRVSPLLQALSLTLLLIILFLVPLLSHFLETLLSSGADAVRWFPPFWFLGMYETLLDGSRAGTIFHSLAARGAVAMLLLAATVAATYPIAYRRSLRSTIEGAATRHSRNPIRDAWHALLHTLWIRRPQQRGVYHFISQTLMRGARNRVYLSMYAGLGLALIVAGTVTFRIAHGRLELAFSTYGLLSAIPIVVFWVVSGLRVALRATVDAPASWLFRIIDRHPQPDYVRATHRWVLLRALLIACAAVLLGAWLKPSLAAPPAIAAQAVIASALCLLLTDAFSLRMLEVPFTVPRSTNRLSLAVMLVLYLFAFPPLVWSIADHHAWLVHHLVRIVVLAALAHLAFRYAQWRTLRERATWGELEDEDEFPQRLGLR